MKRIPERGFLVGPMVKPGKSITEVQFVSKTSGGSEARSTSAHDAHVDAEYGTQESMGKSHRALEDDWEIDRRKYTC
jgi:hypothetical protein